MYDYEEEDYLHAYEHGVRELTGLPVVHQNHALRRTIELVTKENAELRRKIEKMDIETGLAEFYKLQAEVALAQTIRASSVLTVSTIVSCAVAGIMFFTGMPWLAISMAWALGGGFLFYRVASLIWPNKYDNLNVMERRLEVRKAAIEVDKVYRNAVQKEEAAI